MCGDPRSKHALIQKRPEIKQKNKFFTVLKSRVKRKSQT